jgi:hypothetical protein
MKKKDIIPPAIIGLKSSGIAMGEVGVFALTDLPAGTMIGDVNLLNEGPFVPWSEYPSFTEESQAKIDAFCLGTAEGFTLPADFNYLSIP